MAEDKRKRLAFAICDYLQESISNGTIKEDDAEGIEGTLRNIYVSLSKGLCAFFA